MGDIVPREIKEIYDIALTDLKNSENSEVEWERDVFKITKNLFDDLILPTLKTKVNAGEINIRLIFHSIFVQIRSALYWQLEKRDEKIFKYEYSGERKKFDIISQLSPRRKISLRTKEAESFIRFSMLAPAALTHYMHSNISNWSEEYWKKNVDFEKVKLQLNHLRGVKEERQNTTKGGSRKMKEILEDRKKLRNFVNAKLKEGLIANDIANELNISRRTLFKKTKEYDISLRG